MKRTDTDDLSLTLPKAEGRSIRRRRRPSGDFWFFLVLSIGASTFAAWLFATGLYLYACCNAWTGIYAWNSALAAKDRRLLPPWWAYSALANAALTIVLIITGVGT